MSNRIVAKPNQQATLPASLRTGLYDGVPTEASDRRAVAMFALDEPETSAESFDGIVAFLPEVCTPAFARR